MLYEYLHKHYHFKVKHVHFLLTITAMIWNYSNCQKLRYNDVTKKYGNHYSNHAIRALYTSLGSGISQLFTCDKLTLYLEG